MYLNRFADGLDPVDMTGTEEFASLLASARDLDVPFHLPVRYTSRNAVVNGLRFHFLDWGDPAAPAVVLLHGGHQSAHSWDLVSLALAHRYRIIALDQRGHGDSEWPRDGEVSRRIMADDASKLIESLSIVRPVVVGHSMGGLVTMTLLAENGCLAERAVLVDVGPELSPEGGRSIRRFIASAVEFDTTEDFVERVTAYDPFRSREHIARTIRYNLMRRADGKFVSKHDARRWPTAGARSISVPSMDEAERITCPVLVIRGAQSNVLLPEAAERFIIALPNGRLVTVAACGHNVHSQNTLGFLRALTPFLDGHPSN